jgi:hypothetical protein
MKKIYLLLLLLNSFLFSEIIVGEKIKQFKINDQFDTPQMIQESTEKIIFVFSKDKGHEVRNFLDKQSDAYLKSKNILFVADVSKMPAIIRWFVLDSLDKYQFSIALIEDDEIAKNYRDEKRIDQIMVVNINNFIVTGIDYFDETEELKTLIENN